MAKKTFSREAEARIREILAMIADKPMGNAPITVHYRSIKEKNGKGARADRGRRASGRER